MLTLIHNKILRSNSLVAINHFFIFLFFCFFVIQDSVASTLKLLSDDGPPHMIAATKSGIDIDITRNILISMGYQVVVDFAPLKRSMVQVKYKQADLFLPTFFQQDTEHLFISAPIIKYRPTIFSLKNKQFSFKQIADLKGKKIISFQGATGYFGEEFKATMQQSDYRELPDMSRFAEVLLAERCEVVVLDYYIFYYFLRQSSPTNRAYLRTIKNIETFNLIPEVNAHVGFNNRKIRDQFNRHLEQFKAQNKDSMIIEKYIGTINKKNNK